jgi:hypothetical protein
VLPKIGGGESNFTPLPVGKGGRGNGENRTFYTKY